MIITLEIISIIVACVSLLFAINEVLDKPDEVLTKGKVILWLSAPTAIVLVASAFTVGFPSTLWWLPLLMAFVIAICQRHIKEYYHWSFWISVGALIFEEFLIALSFGFPGGLIQFAGCATAVLIVGGISKTINSERKEAEEEEEREQRTKEQIDEQVREKLQEIRNAEMEANHEHNQ